MHNLSSSITRGMFGRNHPIPCHAQSSGLFRVRSFSVLGASGKSLHNTLVVVDVHVHKPEPSGVIARGR